ncbi:MAG: hypothetical protein IT210_18345 [Armatimonadetes bacterium]|nr:hypothetical protein [Armatimonadota bacterium]
MILLIASAMRGGGQEPAMEWTFEAARQCWPAMTKAVQHVGVPGCQWQAGVYWDGALIIGQTLHRDVYRHPRIAEEVEIARLGDNRLHLSVGYGDTFRLPDRAGTNAPAVRRFLEGGCLPIPHIETSEGGLVWHETVYARLAGRPMEAGMDPRPDDMPVIRMRFQVKNSGRARRTGHLWLHFGDTTGTQGLSRQLPDLAPALPHTFSPPYGEIGGRVRYLLPAPVRGALRWRDALPPPPGSTAPARRVIEWEVALAPGEAVDLLLILPYGLIDRRQATRLLKQDDRLLFDEVKRFWKKLVYGPCRIATPEPFINDYLAAVAGQMAQQICYRHRAGLWMLKTSPNWYEDYYPANAARALPAFDLRGLTHLSRPVLASFIAFQSDDAGGLLVNRTGGEAGALSGESGLGGVGFARRKGFLGNFGPPVSAVPPGDPRQGWTANISLMCHGAELFALAAHYRITRDSRWLRSGRPSPLEAILDACDWIAFQRDRTLQTGTPYRGLLPPASAHDWLSGSAIFNDAFCIYGMAEAARLLREIRHPRAGEVAESLRDYRACLRDRYREARDRARPFPLPDGTEIPFAPRLVDEPDWASVDWTYTGYGPLRAGGLGALDPDDGLVSQALAFAETGRPSEGGREFLWRHYVEQETHWPMYDLFLARDDLPRFFELFFHTMAAAVHPDFRVGCEARDGVVACAPGDSERWQMSRQLFVRERGGYDGSEQELWLLQAIPRSWLRPGSRLGVRDTGTYFGGRISLSLKADEAGKSISAEVRLKKLSVCPKAVLIRLRSGDGRPLRSAEVNGSSGGTLPGDLIRLPAVRNGVFKIIGRYE